MLKTAVALRQKIPARWLSSCSSDCVRVRRKMTDDVRVRVKLSEEDIIDRRRRYIANKIWSEIDVLDCYDDSFLKLERSRSEDFDELKSLLNDLKKYNRKNGIAPPRRKYREPPVHRWGNPIPDSWKPRNDDTGVVESAQLAVKEYNKQHGSSLEFVNVLSIEMRSFAGDCNFVIQTRDPAAAAVSVKLDAHCVWTNHRVKQVSLRRPVSSINLLLGKDDKNKTGDGAIEALLYANLRNCPLIARRLGLKRQAEHYGYRRGPVLNVSLDDDCVMRVAQFAVNHRSNLRLLRVAGAWRIETPHLAWEEEMEDRRYLYHVVFEASEEDGRERRFYSAISVNAQGLARKLVDLVALDSPRPTIK